MSAGLRSQATMLALAVGMGAIAHRAQVRADAARFSAEQGEPTWLMPNPPIIRAASLGYQQPIGDLLWVRAVLLFVDIFDSHDREGTHWLRAVIEASSWLDPRWASPLRWGGGMLRVCDDVDSSDAIYARGEQLFPDEPYFPFSLAMNAYLVRHDVDAAAEHLHRAAELPRAPRWYRAAAAGFMEEHGRREAAIRYLREQIAGTSDPSIVRANQQKLNRLLYLEAQDELDRRRRRFRERTGRDITSVGDLAPLPRDPWGGRWIIGPDGRVVSSKADERRAARDVKAERNRLVRQWPEDWRPPGDPRP